MQRITEELIRKRSEHNDREIGSLEEISLHQEDIGKLEHIQHWCKDLKILLLHNNLISKIENLGKLKKLEYINFSLNNITKVENLEGCESLEKLDFTLNFIGDLLSIEKLKSNIHLHTLYLNGNPCTDYEGYRDYVIATLPNLKYLDGQEILRSERIQALQRLGEITPEIIRQQNQYLANWYKTRTDEDFRSDYEDEYEEEEDDEDGNKKKNEEEEDDNFWSQVHGNCPEVRIELAKNRRRREKAKQEKKPPKKKPRRLFNDNGEPLNVNQPKIQFTLDDDYWNSLYTLDVAVYKHLDIALINADVNPFYVRVVIKGKILQLRLDEEVCPDKSIAKRSQTTGHLVITMPKVKEVIRPYKTIKQLKKENVVKPKKKEKINREFLEVQGEFDLKKALTISNEEKKATFIDNPEVPPLE
uniref:Protein phosphatase 1 regulatory subunit n=1 Tax=Triatoma infestans TaxID=30076 RepID=A0A023F2L4_TRIIF